ncbi:MAG: DUF2188 domain-containing protein [Patescibacteria group bacterium]
MDKYDLTHDGDSWKLKRQDAERASEVYDGKTKEEAVREAADFMKEHPGSMRIHKKDGTFEEERTYPRSEDPRQSPG